jgi:TPR repeat protein
VNKRQSENLAREWSEDPDAPEIWDALQHAISGKPRGLDELVSFAENGSTLAMIYVASAYLDGKYTALSDKGAGEYWLSKATAGGSVEAAYRQGARQLKANRVQDAIKTFESIEGKYPPAGYALGLLFFEGKSQPRDIGRAKYHAVRSMKLGHLLAKDLVGRIAMIDKRSWHEWLKGLRIRISTFFEVARVARQNLESDRIKY